MQKIKNLVRIGIVIVLVVVFLAPNVAAADTEPQHQNGNVYLFINGGFGVHFTIINDKNETVYAQWDIFGEGMFFNTTWHRHGSFSAAPNVWTSAPPKFVPFSFMPITAYLYTDGDHMLSRSGFSFMGFVLLFM